MRVAEPRRDVIALDVDNAALKHSVRMATTGFTRMRVSVALANI